jgi:hypothetical protein
MKIVFRQAKKRRKSTPENQRLNVAKFLSYENIFLSCEKNFLSYENFAPSV